MGWGEARQAEMGTLVGFYFGALEAPRTQNSKTELIIFPKLALPLRSAAQQRASESLTPAKAENPRPSPYLPSHQSCPFYNVIYLTRSFTHYFAHSPNITEHRAGFRPVSER